MRAVRVSFFWKRPAVNSRLSLPHFRVRQRRESCCYDKFFCARAGSRFFPPQLFLLYLHLSPPFDSVWFSYACPIEPISDFYSPLMRLRRSRFSGIIPQSPVVHRLTNVFDEIDEEERAARGGITGYWCLFFLLVKHQSKWKYNAYTNNSNK